MSVPKPHKGSVICRPHASFLLQIILNSLQISHFIRKCVHKITSFAVIAFIAICLPFVSLGADSDHSCQPAEAVTGRISTVTQQPVQWPAHCGVHDDGSVYSFMMHPYYPNPFNSSTKIRFYIPVNTRVNLDVYNILGQKIVSLISGELNNGLHSVQWNGVDNRGHEVASGIYFCRLDAGVGVRTTKMLLLR